MLIEQRIALLSRLTLNAKLNLYVDLKSKLASLHEEQEFGINLSFSEKWDLDVNVRFTLNQMHKVNNSIAVMTK